VPPGWEFEWLGATWTAAVLVPLLVVGVFIAVVAGYPFLEERLVPAGIDPLVLDRPRNAATRTAVGAAGIAFVGTLWAAGAADHAAVQFHLSLEAVLVCFQAAVVLVPPATFAVTRRLCLGLQRKDLEIVAHGRETGRIVRLPGGRYTEVHEGGGVAEEWRLGDASGHTAEASAVFPGDSPRSGGVIRESRKVDTP
jgi:ubiquinol-cytochrome c reductase cytochrome b subunit